MKSIKQHFMALLLALFATLPALAQGGKEANTKADSRPHTTRTTTSVSTGGNPIDQLIANMVYVEGGTFMMGATADQGSDASITAKPAHSVTLPSFSIGRYMVTQAQWDAIMGSNESLYEGPNNPVTNVSWNDCQKFIKKLNKLTGKKFRLPTEAEWEYAARGGKKSRGYRYSGSNKIGDVAWYKDNHSQMSHEVGGREPNELGIYDMSGHLWEWCNDWYDRDYYEVSPSYNPQGPSRGSDKVNRGGCMQSDPQKCAVSYRSLDEPDTRYSILGFRLAL